MLFSFLRFPKMLARKAQDSILSCSSCDQKFKDPRMLPCGKSFCNNCIDLLADTNKLKIKCQNCGKTHEIPQEGFPQSIELTKILPLCRFEPTLI